MESEILPPLGQLSNPTTRPLVHKARGLYPMNIERKSAPVKRTSLGKELAKAVAELKPNQCLRLSTAREVYTLGSMRGLMARQGLRVTTQLEGDDVLVFKCQ